MGTNPKLYWMIQYSSSLCAEQYVQEIFTNRMEAGKLVSQMIIADPRCFPEIKRVVVMVVEDGH